MLWVQFIETEKFKGVPLSTTEKQEGNWIQMKEEALMIWISKNISYI